MNICFECGGSGDIHQHHVVPKSRGGTKTIPLCEKCHGKVHGKKNMSVSKLTSDAMKKMKAEGKYTGGRPPYGFKSIDGKLEVVEHEQEAIRIAVKCRIEGMTLRAIGDHLFDLGYTSRTDTTISGKSINSSVKAFHHSSIDSMIKNKLHAKQISRMVGQPLHPQQVSNIIKNKVHTTQINRMVSN